MQNILQTNTDLSTILQLNNCGLFLCLTAQTGHIQLSLVLFAVNCMEISVPYAHVHHAHLRLKNCRFFLGGIHLNMYACITHALAFQGQTLWL